MRNRGEEWSRSPVPLLCGHHITEENIILITEGFKVSILSTVPGKKRQYYAVQAHFKVMIMVTVPAKHQAAELGLNTASCVAIQDWENNPDSVGVNAVQT